MVQLELEDEPAHVSQKSSYNGQRGPCHDCATFHCGDTWSGRGGAYRRRAGAGGIGGLPKRSLERLSVRLFEDRKTASAYKFKVVPAATWKRRTRRLSVDESERTERLARVLAHAEHVWDDREQAREWMSKPHRELQNRSPLDVSRTELGARRVEDLLDKLFYGLPI